MTKEEALHVIRLLSALESWAFSVEKRLPDHLFEDIGTANEILTREILG